LFVRISGSTPSPSPGETAPLPELSPLRLVPPTPAAVRAGPVLTVHTPTPSVWTSDASQASFPNSKSILPNCYDGSPSLEVAVLSSGLFNMYDMAHRCSAQADESVLSVCRQSSRRGRAVSDFTPESTLRRPSTPLGQPGTQRIPEMGIHSTPQRVGHAECPRSCPPPDTIERQFTAGLALDEDDDYSLLEDFQMPLQVTPSPLCRCTGALPQGSPRATAILYKSAILEHMPPLRIQSSFYVQGVCCNLASDVTSPAVQVLLSPTHALPCCEPHCTARSSSMWPYGCRCPRRRVNRVSLLPLPRQVSFGTRMAPPA
jgi:hypothetical protein